MVRITHLEDEEGELANAQKVSLEQTTEYCYRFTENINDFVRCVRPVSWLKKELKLSKSYLNDYSAHIYNSCVKFGVKPAKCEMMTGSSMDEFYEMWIETFTKYKPIRNEDIHLAIKATKMAREGGEDDDDEEDDDE